MTPDEAMHDKQDTAIGVLHDLQQSMSSLSREMAKRPTEQQTQDALEYNRKRGLLGLKVGGVVICLMLIFLGLPLLINSYTNRNAGRVVENCTSPGAVNNPKDQFDTGHKCFDENTRRLSNMLNSEVNEDIVVLQCFRESEQRPPAEFEACVRNSLKAETGGAP